MTKISFQADGQTIPGYLALPPKGQGPGVLVLPAWWGLNDFFKALCDRLAQEGFVALSPDLYHGKVATTIDEAKQLIEQLNFPEAKAAVLGATDYLRQHPAVQGTGLGTVGFSMGAAYGLLLSGLKPEAVKAVVVFYGLNEGDFAAARAAYLGHYAEEDAWEPLEGVRQLEAELRAAGREVTFYIYPGVGHWFVETDRPEYNPEAAQLAWERTFSFLRQHLGQ
jgi:carboxymethylenebutenolidase